jgi:hypothetical protein
MSRLDVAIAEDEATKIELFLGLLEIDIWSLNNCCIYRFDYVKSLFAF